MVTLTKELIELLMTPAGGWNRATLDAIGVGWPPQKGWKDRLTGHAISDRNWAAAVKAAKEGPIGRSFQGNTRGRR